MLATDQSFPLAGTFAYSVFRFQEKRVKRDPEGPFFGGNPIVGAILSTVISFGLACGVSRPFGERARLAGHVGAGGGGRANGEGGGAEGRGGMPFAWVLYGC